MEKKCPKCKTIKDIKEFNKNKNSKDGYDCYCRECYKLYRKRLYENIEIEVKKEKECLNCKETKDINNFSKKYYSKDRKYAICNQCLRILFLKPQSCECGREIKWTQNYSNHLKTKVHNDNI